MELTTGPLDNFYSVFKCSISFLARIADKGLGELRPGLEVIKPQLRLIFILLINVKMPTIVGVLAFISRINYRLCSSKPSTLIYLDNFSIYEESKFQAQLI